MLRNLKNKKVLVTGMSGFFAPHIAKLLYNLGADIIGTIHDHKKKSYLETTKLNEKMTIVYVDINDLQRIEEIINNYDIEYIFHCAANAIISKCAINPIGCFKTNIIGTANILEASRKIGGIKGIVCMESDKSYGSFDEKDLPYREDQPIKPKNIYEVSKACSGLIAQSYINNYDLPIYTIRAANLYGPGDPNMSRIIPRSIIRLFNDEAPILYDGVANYIREFLYVEDAAKMIVGLMENIEVTKGETYNLGSGDIHKIKDVIKIICEKINPDIKPMIVKKDIFFKEIEKQYLDCNKIKNILPNIKMTKLNGGLNKTILWYDEHKELYGVQ